MHKDRIQPVGIILMQTENKAFVALGPSNHVAMINTDTMTIEKYILVGRRVWQLALNTDESLLLTTNGVSSDVSIINTQSAKVEKSVKVGRYPWGVAVKQL
jgi:YVTN family beta-propeller protein